MTETRRAIQPSTSEVRFPNGTTVEVRSYTGMALQRTNDRVGARTVRLPAQDDVSPTFRDALEELGMYEQETIWLDVTDRVQFRGARASAVADSVRVEPAPPPPKAVQVILYQDESGGLSWHFRDGHRGGEGKETAALRAGRNTFTIDARTPAAVRSVESQAYQPSLRGPITKVGRKIFRILVIPLSHAAGPLLESIVGRAEGRLRQELLRGITPGDYRSRVSTPFSDWPHLRRGRALLIVHGILSNTEGVLSRMPRTAMELLHQAYGGRVVAYDHLTVSRHPQQNAEDLLAVLRGASGEEGLELDVLCHSRGGIVTRTIIERLLRPSEAERLRFRKVFFVATPNAGSPLGDGDRILDTVDLFTNLLTNFPDGPVTYSIEVLLAIVKFLAYGAADALPGIAAMNTEADGFIRGTLNKARRAGPTQYAAASADYKPLLDRDNAYLTSRALDLFADRLMGEENDLVVPERGVWSENGHPAFPLAERLRFNGTDSVWHTDFFSRRRTLEAICKHFEIGLPEPAQIDLRGEDPELLRSSRARKHLHRGLDVKLAEAAHARTRQQRLSRDASIEFEPRVRSLESRNCVVALEESHASAALLDLASTYDDEQEIELTIALSAPGFDYEPLHVPIVVSSLGDRGRERARFVVTPHAVDAPTARTISAEILRGTRCIASVKYDTLVVPAGAELPPNERSLATTKNVTMARSGRLSTDLALFVLERDSGVYELLVRSEIEGEIRGLDSFGTFRFDAGGLQDYLNGFYDWSADPYPGEEDAATLGQWEERFADKIAQVGKVLWDWLPPAFRRFYFDLADGNRLPQSMFIQSDEMIFPWDLVVPYAGGQALPPFGIAHILGRWLNHKLGPEPQKFPVKRIVAVHPRYERQALAWTAAEMEKLRQLFRTASFEVLEPATLAAFKTRVLGVDDVQLIHFSGHAESDGSNADRSRLLLEDFPVQAIDFAGARVGSAQPLLYVNACSAASGGVAAARMSGLVLRCVHAGFSGIIAPYWRVNDRRAFEIATSLYEKLLIGRSVGEALQEIRAESPRDPNTLAFTYFGDPWTRIVLDVV